MDVCVGIWFDLITISLIYLPYSVLFLLPIPIRHTKWYKRIFKYLFHLITAGAVILNLIDTAYFPYTSKRSTRDLIDSIVTGDDFNQLWGTFLSEQFVLVLLLIGIIILTEFLYRKTDREVEQVSKPRKSFYLFNSMWMLVSLAILIIVGRGGFRPKPIGILDAANYTTSQNTALVLNTPLTFLKTLTMEGIKQKNYFSREKELSLFNPIRESQPANLLPDKTNVVIIILESFGMEFVGGVSGKESYTPFLDSMLLQSMFYETAFANGKKSNEAVPAIMASIPSWMDDPYISSPYGDNKIVALPTILKEFGYSSAFFHAATNGSMLFDSFSVKCGFDQYFGRNEYGNDSHYDGRWGISDGYFNPWAAKKISELKEPFCSAIFTCSSHHPYFIPEEFKKHTKEGPQKICGSISYGDYALKLFFDQAKKEGWYDNTLFVFVADHSPGSKTPLYSVRTHMYRIPIAFFHPKGLLPAGKNPAIAQQMDIFPTVLDLLNVKKTYYSFGSSLLQNTDKQAVSYLQGSYYQFIGDRMMTFSSDKAQNLFNFTIHQVSTPDSLLFYRAEVQSKEDKLKAMIQRYNRDLILNQTSAEHEATH
jgi:phosphoglycerol transferase MdoB-like AlkP superfamily enzyme